MTARKARINCLALARVSYPGPQMGSGAAQEHLRRLDSIFAPDGFRAEIEAAPDGFRVLSLDGAYWFNIPTEQLPYVLRSWEDET